MTDTPGSAGDKSEDRKTRADDRLRAGEWFWLIPACAATGVLAVLLISMESKGAQIAQTLALVVSIITCLLTVHRREEGASILPPRSSRPPMGHRLLTVHRRGEGASIPPPRSSRPPMGHRLLSAIPLIILTVTVGWWTFVHKPDANVTDLVMVSDARGMRDMAQASVTLPAWDSPGLADKRRDKIALTLRLVNSSQVGNCVAPATLEVAPTVDGKRGSPVTVHSDEEVRLSLTGAERKAGAHVVLALGDPMCEVDLVVIEAVLFN
jgi:hypothetical protein